MIELREADGCSSGVHDAGDHGPQLSIHLMILRLAALFLAQGAPATIESPSIDIELEPAAADSELDIRWSPKAAKTPLQLEPGTDVLVGEFPLGPKGTANVMVRLSRSEGAVIPDRLQVDRNRDGRFGDDELMTATPTERNRKWWSSFTTEVRIPMAAEGGAEPSSRPYPISLWHVFDPREPAMDPVLRWSRRGWHEAQCSIGGKMAYVIVTESVMDGIFDQRDAWMLAREPKGVSAKSASLASHCWLDGVAYRPLEIDQHGLRLRIEAFDPGFTEAEEKARNDIYEADRRAARAEKPLAFGHDFAAALAQAKKLGKPVFADFETTWCGPCKQMDQMVYTAKAVVDAAAGVVPVKLDGDEQRELVKKYKVEGYPTMLLIGSDGKVLKREVGYQSVAAMVEFLKQSE